MTRCLISGAGGFLGSHLAEFLVAKEFAVYGTVHKDKHNLDHIEGKIALLPCDMMNRQQVEAAILKAEPEVVYHLAAQSLPALSWKDPEATFRVNVFGTLNLLESVRNAALDPVIVVACSSAEYGFSTSGGPVNEEDPLRPASPYGVSKAAADLLSHLYCCTYGMKIIRVRPFLVIGPRKTGDACSDFARGIVAVERGEQPSLKVGNLAAMRDFIDVQDAVRALWILAEKGAPSDVYNVCSGVGVKVQEVLNTLVSLADRPIPVEQDPSRMRLLDEPVIVGDNSRLRGLGWEPQMRIDKTLANLLEYWREATSAEASTAL